MALVAGQGIHLLTQLALPPAFLMAYGVQAYGEWLVLSAAIGFLTVLDFGLQTYLLNELTALYHRHEMDRFHRLQSTGLRMVVGIVLITSLLALTVLVIPVKDILGLSISRLDAVLTLYLLGLQLLFSIVSGQINGTFRIVGMAHRGSMWSNAQKSLLLVITIALVLAQAPFWLIALGQLVAVCSTVFVPLVDLKKVAPQVFPQLSFWDQSLAKSIVVPSGFFSLFILNNFLLFQVPVLIVNHYLGPQIVVLFTVSRTMFSFVRQGITLIQGAIAPEITRLSGIMDRGKLVRLYQVSESAALSSALALNVAVYLFAPALLWLWLRRPELFDTRVFLLLMAISILMSVKEYKLYFQYATNNHAKTSVLMFVSYIVMITASLLAVQWTGLNGVLGCWVIVELVQIGFIHQYNVLLLDGAAQVTLKPIGKLGIILILVVLGLALAREAYPLNNYLLQGLSAISAMFLLVALSYHAFNLRYLAHECRIQVQQG